jgi:hypothetical protein
MTPQVYSSIPALVAPQVAAAPLAKVLLTMKASGVQVLLLLRQV